MSTKPFSATLAPAMGAGDGLIDRRLVLDWYEPRREAFPWRSNPDPYHVLVAEFMLQQTQVGRVVPAHAAFLGRFPSVEALAESSAAEVIRAWAGLGYNRRAVALWRTAGAVVERFGGRIPERPEDLRSLPGIGPYTSAAIASQAYGYPAAAVDTNVRRVVGRALLGAEPSELAVATVQDAASAWLDRGDPGGWNQALMDLGRQHCRPAPSCSCCPLLEACAAPRTGGRTAPADGAASRASARARSRSGRRAGALEASGSSSRAGRFEGSFRQVRGKVVSVLRAGPPHLPMSVVDVVRAVGEPADRVVRAIEALARDGIASADDAALAGEPSGQVALPG